MRLNLLRLSLSRQRLLDLVHPLPVGFGQAVKQAIGADIQGLTKTGKTRDRKGISALFQIADRLPVHPHQFSQTLLSQVGGKARFLHIRGDNP